MDIRLDTFLVRACARLSTSRLEDFEMLLQFRVSRLSVDACPGNPIHVLDDIACDVGYIFLAGYSV